MDNIVERLAPCKIPIVRIGHPARLLPSVLSHSLDVLTQTSDAGGLVKDIQKEMDAKQASIKKTRNGRERRAIYLEIRDLRKEFRERENQCVDSLVSQSKVVLATLHGAGGHQLRGSQFDVVVIDEASQALEAQSWIPLLTAKKVVLAGDHLQLPPTVKSLPHNTPKDASRKADEQNASIKGKIDSLEVTLFDRLLSLYGPSIKRMLKVQYRMNDHICAFPSHELYGSELTSDPSVATHLLPDLHYPIESNDDTREPLIFYDTQGGDFPEAIPTDAEPGLEGKRSIMMADSKSNPLEASLAANHVRTLLQAGVREEDIAVITPYNAQLSLLSSLLKSEHPGLELGSVDGFQGREKEVVVLSLVRSNVDEGGGAGKRGEVDVGFLSEKRRLNVAMTRAKKQLVVIGDSETVGKGSGFLKRWMAFLEEKADVRYPDVGEVLGSG